MKVLSKIQQELEELYRLPHRLNIADFLIDPQELKPARPQRAETVFIDNRPGEYRIGLYLSPTILSELDKNPPWQSLTAENLDSFCTAVEGVSHLLYLVSRICQQRPVSNLELELQAEIDKFLLCSLLLERQRNRHDRLRLKTTLFDRYRLLDDLTPEEVDRYELANRLAFQFSTKLQRVAHPLTQRKMIAIARRFRETGLQGKIHLLTTDPLQANLR